MSATRQLAEAPDAGPAPSPLHPDAAGDPPATRLTATQMVRRLLSRQDNAYRLRDPEIVPMGGEAVLRAVAKLIAASEGGGVYPLHPTLSPGGLARQVVVKLRLVNSPEAERQVGVFLGALEAAELIEQSAEGVRLPLPPEPEARPHPGGFEPFLNSCGPRKGWMTQEQFDDYRKLHRDGHAAQKAGDLPRAKTIRERMNAMRPAQRSILLPMTGAADPAGRGGDTVLPGRADIDRHIDIRPADARHIGPDMTRAAYRGEVDMQPDIAGSRAAAAALASEDIDSGYQAAAASGAKPRASVREAISATISTPISAGDMPGPISEADRLAGEMVRRFGMDAAASVTAATTVQGWLDLGATAAVIRGLFDEKEPGHQRARRDNKRGIGSPAYFDAAIRHHVDSTREKERLDRIANTRAEPAPGPTPAAGLPAAPLAPDPGCPPEIADAWLRVREATRSSVGDAQYRTWMRTMRVAGLEDGDLTVDLDTRFLADHVRKEFGDALIARIRKEAPAVRHVVFRAAPRPDSGGAA